MPKKEALEILLGPEGAAAAEADPAEVADAIKRAYRKASMRSVRAPPCSAGRLHPRWEGTRGA